MSRRKQSNPKPIKHEGEEEEPGFGEDQLADVAASETGMETSSKGEVKVSAIHISRDNTSLSEELNKYSQKTKSVSDNNVVIENTDHEDNKSNTRANISDDYIMKERSSNSLRDKSLSVKSETMYVSDMVDTNGCEENEKGDTNLDSCDHSNDKPAEQIKRELSISPPIDGRGGDSDRCGANQLNSESLHYKLSNKYKRRNRSRSRSSSKSIGIPGSPDAPPTSSQSREEAERALVNQLQLPSDVLYLRQQEMTIQGIASLGWVVCCAIPLPQGSSLGPFQGQLVAPEAVKVGDLIVQFTSKKGQQALMNVAGESGGWLALLRSAAAKTERNTHVYWEGGRIWCEIIADIEIGTELTATFSFQNDEDNEDEGDDEVASTSEIKDTEVPPNEDTSGAAQQLQHPYQQQVAPGHAALIYGCPFCGVRFSSPRTLQGHLSFYCSKKTSDQIVSPASKERDKGNNQGKIQLEGHPVKQESDVQPDNDLNDGSRPLIDSNKQLDTADPQCVSTQAKVGRPGQVFKCKHCSYKADKLSSLNRHMRMHNNDKIRVAGFLPDEKASCSNSEHTISSIRSPNSETFCKECRIQFSNLHTYRCHKEHYCAQRRKKALADPSAFAAMFHSPFSLHDATKVGVPSALQMAALNQGGLILPGTSRDTAGLATSSVLLSAPVITASGMANIAISLPTMLMPSMVSGQDVVAALTSPRAKGSSENKKPHLSSSQASSHALPLTHFLNLATTTQADYTRVLEELHKSKDLTAIKTDTMEEDHPLDLTITKKEIKSEQESSKEDIQTNSTFLQPDRDGALDARRIIRSPCQASSAAAMYQQPKDLKDDSNSPAPSSLYHGTSKMEPVEFKKEAISAALHSQQVLRPGHLTPNSMIVQVLPHPSILVSPAGFLSMPLTLSPPTKRVDPLSPSGTANGISKCADCNIVFYKHDNYLIHKKHYCSGKRRLGVQQTSNHDTAFLVAETDTKTQPEVLQPLSPAPPQSPPFKPKKDLKHEYVSSGESSQDSKASPPRHSSEVKYKFYCVPCRIKFSNSSILEAHKEYYCPAGKDSEQSVIVHTASSEAVPVPSPKDDREHTSPDSPPTEFTCTRCNINFVSARLLRLHVCDGGFPCPHCDHVSITENRLAEHLKVHAPTKAYRCTICGYRGNTARGMRMHGKTHIDEGLDFTDENMLAYHEPALIPVLHSPYPGASTDTELLRLKNEPYKRRRSRKAYEKFDYPLPKPDFPQTCPLCGQNFASADYLASHLKVHEIAASQYMTGLMKCVHCGYIGTSPDNLCSHFEEHHTSKNRSKRRRLSSPDSEEQNDHGRSVSPSMWRSPGKARTAENEENVSMTRDSHSPLEDSKVQHKSSERYSSSSRNEDSQLESLPSSQITIKNEPVQEHTQDSKLASKVSHFLQTPNQSPEPCSTNDTDTRRQFGSPSSSNSWIQADSPTNSSQGEQHSEYMTCKDSGRLESCKMETEPGEINSTHIKPEPRDDDYENEANNDDDDNTDQRLQLHSHSDRDSKKDSYDSVRDHKSEKPEVDACEMSSDAHHSNSSNVLADFERRSRLAISREPRQGLTSTMSAINTPNFLISSPPHGNPSRSPSAPSTSIRLSSASSSFQTTVESPVTTTSLTTVFPLHPSQTHAISFPCSTPQISLPYLFLPPVQPGSSLPITRSPNIADERIIGARYCQNCDISFSKHATYLAHKKYYCTARPRGEVQSSAKA